MVDVREAYARLHAPPCSSPPQPNELKNLVKSATSKACRSSPFTPNLPLSPTHVPLVQNEFKTLVKECHKRGIEVILDVVFNHTAEGNEKGPTLSFRGLDNRIYYMLAPGAKQSALVTQAWRVCNG